MDPGMWECRRSHRHHPVNSPGKCPIRGSGHPDSLEIEDTISATQVKYQRDAKQRAV